MIIPVIFICVTLLYLILIAALNYGFDKIELVYLQDDPPKTSFTVIVPFRNEEKYLQHLVNSIGELNYPSSLYEIIFVDDNSTDTSVELISNYFASKSISYKIIQLENKEGSPKKRAISSAIALASFEWIITTDADCKLPKFWLDSYDEFIQNRDCNCIVGPVALTKASNFLERFQSLDILSLQAATIGGFGINKPFLCNGANLAYKANVFSALDGFKGNNHIASGDDIFLLEKMLTLDPEKVKYLKSSTAIVETEAMKSISDLVNQRIRWASKTTRYKNWFGKFAGVTVLLANAVLLLLFPFYLLDYLTSNIAISLFVIKLSIDFLLIFKASRFLNKEELLSSYVLSSLLYPLFSLIIALSAPFKSYKWKGRSFKQ